MLINLNLNQFEESYKSSSGDEIPERDVTYYLNCLLIYHRTINRTTHSLPEIFLSNAYLLHIMDVGLQKVPCVSCYYPLSVFLA